MVRAEFIVECDDCGAEDREDMSSGYEGWDHNDVAMRLHGWHHIAERREREIRGRKRVVTTDIHLCPACFAKRGTPPCESHID